MKITGINNSGAKEGIIVFGRISSDLELLTKSKKYNYFYLHRLQFFIPSIFLDREIMSQKKYFDACMEELEINKNTTFVIHDWGSALGFNWAYEHQQDIKGICYMEAIVKNITWDDWPEDAKSIFQGFRSDAGEDLILKKNLFIEGILPNAIIRNLTESEMSVYRRPYIEEIDRRPTLDWPRQIPINNEPEDVCKIVEDYSSWMSINEIPKLFINADPGSILTGKQREFCRKWKNQQELTVRGNHFIQEDSPEEIGEAISNWYRNL